MITSKPTSKARMTSPQESRVALGLQVGNELATEIQDARMILAKANTGVVEDPFASFHEWDSESDRRANAGR